jgi:hypothetical protein
MDRWEHLDTAGLGTSHLVLLYIDHAGLPLHTMDLRASARTSLSHDDVVETDAEPGAAASIARTGPWTTVSRRASS